MSSGVVVVLEQRAGEIKRASIEALAEGVRLARARGGTATAVLVGHGLAAAAEPLRRSGVERVLVADREDLGLYSTEGYTLAAMQAIRRVAPGVVLLPATTLGRDLGPAIALAFDAAYAADCIRLELRDGRVVAVRPVYAGKALATVSPRAEPVVISLRPNVFDASLPQDAPEGPLETFEPDFPAGSLKARVTSVQAPAAGRRDVAEAEIVVSGGRGLGGPEGFAVVEELADVLGGAVGASRAVVDLGWRPHAEQVGQTGKVVSPKLYIACGISGAIQHQAGMRTSKVIVAINRDPEAPIFKIATYGIVGDALQVVPALTEALRKAGS